MALMSLDEFYDKLDGLYDKGDMDGAENFLKQTARVTQPCCGQFNELHLSSLSELGAFYRTISRYEDSASMFRLAEDMILRHLGAESAEYATNANNLAGTYRLMGDYKKAEECFDKAKTAYERSVGKDNYMYSSMLNNIALLKNDMGDTQAAIEYTQEALDAVLGMESAGEEVATSYVNLSALYRKTGENGKALEAIEKALDIFRKMPESPHYPAALNGMASICYLDGDYARAAELYQQAADKVAGLFGENVEYAIANENLGRALSKTGDNAGAKKHMEIAEAVYNKIYGAGHGKSDALKKELAEMEGCGCERS